MWNFNSLISSGYYIRHQAMNTALTAFLRDERLKDAPRQILSLGCGFDPTFFRLQDDAELRSSFSAYVDVDFPDLTARKREMILRAPELCDLLGVDGEALGKTRSSILQVDRYHLLPCDLTRVDQLEALLCSISGFSLDAPTLIVSECVLTYAPTAQSNRILEKLAEIFADATLLIYEQIHPGSSIIAA
jgi:tRNA wybutosine-synthesizing protein 4